MSSKTEKVVSYIVVALLIVLLVPVIYLGRYNHPTGDDYYYGATTHLAWEETGSLGAVLAEAIQGVATEYTQWQGTYSAMLLMYLAPNLFGDWAYRLVPALMISLLLGSIFYLLKPIVCGWLEATGKAWIIIASLLSLLCIQTVPSQGETFFWYNGAMYYTGYFSVTLFFWGIMLRWLKHGGREKVAVMVFLAAFLAGGNYVSLLPVLLLTATLLAVQIYRKNPRAWGIGIIFAAMLGGFAVSALAPGNQLRQAGMWKISAWKAILKSLLQGVRYMVAWVDLWWVTVLAVVTPLLWKYVKRMHFRFSYPLMVVAYIYGIFCSMSCPTFYTMNSTGPARVVAIVYYGFVISFFMGYAYLLGYAQKRLEGKKLPKLPRGIWWACAALTAAVLLLGGTWKDTAVGKAMGSLVSGEAAAYEAEYQERLKLLNDPTLRDVVLPPYQNQPEMLYVGDISGDADEPTNRKVAQYFHKDSVRVDY